MSTATFTPEGAGLASPPIEVLLSNGDRAEAPDPESALVTARTLLNDHWQACPAQGRGRNLTVTFSVAGKHVRTIAAGKL